jgi:hypothetical protein
MRGTRAALLVGLSGAELLELSGLVIRRHRSVRCGICPGRAIAASASPIATIATDRRGALLAGGGGRRPRCVSCGLRPGAKRLIQINAVPSA